MTPTDDLIEALVQMRDILNKQEVPPARYAWVHPETYEELQRIILYPQDKTEDCKMTERTRKEINKDIAEVNNKLKERTMIVGPIWARSIVSFEIDNGVDDPDDAFSFDEWDKEYSKFQNGETSGEIVVTIQSVGCDGGARLTEEILNKIGRIKFDIMMNESMELRELRQERHQLEKVKEAEENLEAVKRGRLPAEGMTAVFSL